MLTKRVRFETAGRRMHRLIAFGYGGKRGYISESFVARNRFGASRSVSV
jgi:hypothetical protein